MKRLIYGKNILILKACTVVLLNAINLKQNVKIDPILLRLSNHYPILVSNNDKIALKQGITIFRLFFD